LASSQRTWEQRVEKLPEIDNKRSQDKISLTSFMRSCLRQKMDNFFLRRSLVSKLDMRAFGQGRLDKCIQEIYFCGFGKQKAVLTAI
jgi:hypothetical protein